MSLPSNLPLNLQKILAQSVGPFLTDASLVSNEWAGPLDSPPTNEDGKTGSKAGKKRKSKSLAKMEQSDGHLVPNSAPYLVVPFANIPVRERRFFIEL